MHYMNGDIRKPSTINTICASPAMKLTSYGAVTVPVQFTGKESHNIVSADVRLKRKQRRKRHAQVQRVANLDVLETKKHRKTFQDTNKPKLKRIEKRTASQPINVAVDPMQTAYLETVRDVIPLRVQQRCFRPWCETSFKNAKKEMQEEYVQMC